MPYHALTLERFEFGPFTGKPSRRSIQPSPGAGEAGPYIAGTGFRSGSGTEPHDGRQRCADGDKGSATMKPPGVHMNPLLIGRLSRPRRRDNEWRFRIGRG